MRLYRLRLHGKGKSWEGGDAMVYDTVRSCCPSPPALSRYGQLEGVTDDEVSEEFPAFFWRAG